MENEFKNFIEDTQGLIDSKELSDSIPAPPPVPVTDRPYLFQPGQSGNPKGRPKGSVDKRILARKMIETCQDGILEKVLELALAGNTDMLKFAASKILPHRAKDEPLQIPELLDKERKEQAKIISDKVANGEITPIEAVNVLSGLLTATQIEKFDDLDSRLRKLEESK